MEIHENKLKYHINCGTPEGNREVEGPRCRKHRRPSSEKGMGAEGGRSVNTRINEITKIQNEIIITMLPNKLNNKYKNTCNKYSRHSL